ncbi:MAG TPA: nitroreductase [Dehalococcoidia bacterium]|nr:nitroreductase [Dehalococcoidia bacterium]
MDVLKAIETRRSIRKYRPDPVDNETVERVLEAARWAPSWANTQCWRFIVVRDVDIKNKLADTLIGVTGKAGQSLQVGPNGEPVAPMKGVAQRPNKAAEAIRDAPVAIVACAELGKTGYYTKDPGEAVTDKGDWFMFDVALAMQNLVLAAHSLGLGTVHVGAFDAKKVAELLAVPRGFAVVEMTPLGYPDEQPTARKRKELAEIMSYERFTVS